LLKVGWPGGKKFNKLFFAVEVWMHDLCAVKERGKGEGGEEMGKGVRVRRGNEYVDGGR
jgi:hypothetical protein